MSAASTVQVEPVATSFESEGETIASHLYAALRDGGPAATVVISPSRITPVGEMRWLAAPLAQAGYDVIVQGYRPAKVRYQLRDVADVRNALTFARTCQDLRSDRYVVIGHSRGASASLRAAAQDDRISAVVAMSAPIDVGRYMHGLRQHSPSRFATLVTGYGATPEADPDYYSEISPLSYAGQIRCPVLLIHGMDDMVAPMENSQRMYEGLRRSGNENVLLDLIPDVGHFFEQRFAGYRFEAITSIVLAWMAHILRATTH